MDEDLMLAADMIEYEKVEVVNASKAKRLAKFSRDWNRDKNTVRRVFAYWVAVGNLVWLKIYNEDTGMDLAFFSIGC